MKPSVTATATKYVTIRLGDDTYGIDVMKAQEITDVPEIMKIPHSINFMKGMCDLRGRVVPLIDLRLKFMLPEKAYDRHTVVIMVDISGELIGLIVDAVSDVVELTEEAIQRTRQFAASSEGEFVAGIAHIGEKMIILLDVDRILSGNELQSVTSQLQENQEEQ